MTYSLGSYSLLNPSRELLFSTVSETEDAVNHFDQKAIRSLTSASVRSLSFALRSAALAPSLRTNSLKSNVYMRKHFDSSASASLSLSSARKAFARLKEARAFSGMK